MRYYILQECFNGHRSCLRPMSYTESGFDTRHKARRYLDKHGRNFSPRIVRADRLDIVKYNFEKRNN